MDSRSVSGRRGDGRMAYVVWQRTAAWGACAFAPMPDYQVTRATASSAVCAVGTPTPEMMMSLHEVAALREAARELYAKGKLMSGGEALGGCCWGLLIVLCVLSSAHDTLLG